MISLCGAKLSVIIDESNLQTLGNTSLPINDFSMMTIDDNIYSFLTNCLNKPVGTVFFLNNICWDLTIDLSLITIWLSECFKN